MLQILIWVDQGDPCGTVSAAHLFALFGGGSAGRSRVKLPLASIAKRTHYFHLMESISGHGNVHA